MPHARVNANRKRSRVAKPCAVEPLKQDHGDYSSVFDLHGRLKVQPHREFDFKVPFEFNDNYRSKLYSAPNPVNQLGAIVQQVVPVVTSTDYHSFMAAFNKRSNFEAPDDDDIDSTCLAEALQLISKLPQQEAWDDNDYDRNRWLDKFDVNKRKAMVEAYSDVSTYTYKYIGTKDLSVKQEVLIKRDDPTWAPRLIYAGNDAFNAVTGPSAMVVMERFVKLTSHTKVGNILFKPAYKTSDVELMDFIVDKEFKQIVEGDFSRNDREQRKSVALIIDAWLAKLGMPAWIRKIWMEINNYKVQCRRYGLTAWIKAQLPTGTTATTFRNSMYNATMFAVTCQRQNRHGKALILGDDILAALNRRLNLDAWVSTVADFKMVLKAKAPLLDGQATFLSRRIFADVDRPCMVPMLGKMLIRFNVRGTTNEQVSDSQYMAGKSLSYAYECRHVPCIRDLFLQRYMVEPDNALANYSDLSWFTKSSGLDIESLPEFIMNEQHTVSNDDFGEWCCKHYDLTLTEVIDMFTRIVLGTHESLEDMPLIENMSCDY